MNEFVFVNKLSFSTQKSRKHKKRVWSYLQDLSSYRNIKRVNKDSQHQPIMNFADLTQLAAKFPFPLCDTSPMNSRPFMIMMNRSSDEFDPRGLQKTVSPKLQQLLATMETNNTSSSDDGEAAKRYMIRRLNLNPKFNKAFAKLSEFADIEYGKITASSIDVLLNQKDKCVNVLVAPLDPPLLKKKVAFCEAHIAFFKRYDDDDKGKELLASLLPNVDPLYYVNISNWEIPKPFCDFSAKMLEAFFTSSIGKRLIIDVPVTILDGFFSPVTLKEYLPCIQSCCLIVKFYSGHQKLSYHKIIKAASPKQSIFHFNQEVDQKFEKRKHFKKLRKIVLSNPSIECFSFSCPYKQFDFEECFKLIADPTFKIKNKTINLNFFFLDPSQRPLYYLLHRKIITLNAILHQRSELSDFIRVQFASSYNRKVGYSNSHGQRQRYAGR